MTKHSMVTLRLHRSAVILTIVLSFVFAILIFVLGYMFAMTRVPKVAVAKPKVPKVALPKVAPPKIALPTATSTTGTTAPVPRGVLVADKPPEEMLAVRVGMFPEEKDAKALVQQLAAAKIAATVTPMPTDAGPTIYLVLVGRYTTRRDAAAAAAWLEKEQKVDTAVMPVP